MAAERPLRARRRRLGLTQAQLAAAAGVSRQLVVAAETGINRPAVDTAIRLATALGCGVEELFTSAVQARSPCSPDPAYGALVVAGCDPALRIAERMLAGAGERSIVALESTTGAAIAALRAGGAHAVAVHGPADALPEPAFDVLRVHFARWQVGLGIAPGLGVRSLADCLEQDVLIIQRPQSATSQQALRRAATALGRELPDGAVAAGHLDAARAAAALCCVALTTEGAARLTGLEFVALEAHTVQIWVDSRWRSHPGFEAFGELLGAPEFAAEVTRFGGYDLAGCGRVLEEPLA